MSARSDGMAHWDDAYAEGEDVASWFQAYPTASLKMLDAAGISADDSVIDVGGGASRFVDALISRGFRRDRPRHLKHGNANPRNQVLKAQVETVFQGTTLRGLLLNAYAFWQIGQIALWAAIAAFIGGAIFLVLSILGFLHMRRTPAEAELQPVRA